MSNMHRFLSPVAIVALVTTTVAAQLSVHQKIPIDLTTVERATIKHAGEERTLSTADLEGFARTWLDAATPTADKYRWDYDVTLLLDAGGIRRFLIQGDRIQESGDWSTWHIATEAYVAELWARSR